MMTFKNKLSLYEVLFYLAIIPLFGLGVYYVTQLSQLLFKGLKVMDLS